MGQVLECPIKGGHFKEFDLFYSHHNPAESAVIVSDKPDSVQSVSEGRVFKILKHTSEYSVIVMTSDSIFLAYRFFSTVLLKEGESITRGEIIGLPGKNDRDRYEIAFSYYPKQSAISVDPRPLLNCKR